MPKKDMTIIEPLCLTCARLIQISPDWRCDAYPLGIPKEIISGKVDHTNPYKDDGGMVFKAK